MIKFKLNYKFFLFNRKEKKMINPVQGYYTKHNTKDSKIEKKSTLLSRNFLQGGRKNTKNDTVKKAPMKNLKKFKTLKSIPSKEKIMKPSSFFKKKINSVTDLENIADNISIIVNYFFE